jgi:hypothetical protein
MHLCLLPITTTKISVEGRWKLAVAEDDRRLVIIVAHSGSPVDEKATTPSLFNASRSAVRTATVADLQAIGASALRFLPLPALNDWTK